MATSDKGLMFLKTINGFKEYKDKHNIAKLIKRAIKDFKATNVVQIITNNVPICKITRLLIKGKYGHNIWTPCVVYTLNLDLKNVFATKNQSKIRMFIRNDIK